jgi:hypothetical protein
MLMKSAVLSMATVVGAPVAGVVAGVDGAVSERMSAHRKNRVMMRLLMNQTTSALGLAMTAVVAVMVTTKQ